MKNILKTKKCQYHYTGTTKAMSVPSKPIKSQVPTSVYDDTDDDDLSDISERSREEDTSDPVANKNTQSLTATHTDDKKDKSYSEPLRTPITGLFTPEASPDYTDKKPHFDQNYGKQALTSTRSDADQQPVLSSTAGKSVVQARRLEHSDSDDTTSATDSHLTKQSAADKFYSPDGSIGDVNDSDDQQPDSWRQHEQKESNQFKSADNKQNQSLSSNHQEKQKDTDEDDNSSNETSSTESQKTPVPGGKMALGEPYIYIYSARFYTV